MLGKIFKLTIYISAYIPIFIMIFLANLKSFSSKNISILWNKNPVLWLIFIVISILSLVFLLWWLYMLNKSYRTSSKEDIEINDADLKDADVLNFFVTFIVPILSLDPTSLPSIVMNLFLLLIEAIYVVNNNSIYNNILLILMGYHVYTFSDDNVVITRIPKDEVIFGNIGAKQFGSTNIYYIGKQSKVN